MKRTFRLTALILALLMLVNISALATTEGYPVSGVDMAFYNRILQSASQAAQNQNADNAEGDTEEEQEYWIFIDQATILLPTADATTGDVTIPENTWVTGYGNGNGNGKHKVVYGETEGYVKGVRACQCEGGSITDPATHVGTCAYPTYFMNLAINASVVDLLTRWDLLYTGEKDFVLDYLKAHDQEKYTLVIGKVDNVNKTEQNITSKGDDENAPSIDASIKVPTDAFDEDYIMNAEAVALDQVDQAITDALSGMHQLAVFDISFESLANGSKLQPKSAVELTFTIDTTNVAGNMLYVHHLADNGDGTYTADDLSGTIALDRSQATQTITVACDTFSPIVVSADCTGGTENGGCGFAVFAAQESGFARAKWLIDNLTDETISFSEQIGRFVDCALWNHTNIADVNDLICLCMQYPYNPEKFVYGGLGGGIVHDATCYEFGGSMEEGSEVVCPWAFERIPVEDQATILKDKTEEERANYLSKLTPDQRAALDAFMNSDETPLEEVVGTTTISVAGNNVDLTGKKLKATAATKDNVIALFAADDPFALMLDAMQNKHKVFDITIYDGAQKWQPGENQSVEVTMSVDDLDTGNDDMLVYHIHVDENGNVAEPELMGPFKADENGNIKFQMDQFSYVMVLNSNLKIENVEVFYPVNTYADSGTFPQSTNGNWCIIGVYYDTNQNAHVLIGQITNNINNDKVQSVTVNGTVIPNNDNNITRYLGNISKITKDTTNGEELVSFENVSKNQINGVWDVDCGKLPMAQVFELSLESNGGFAIGKTEYTLHLEYEISKVVGAGTDDSATFGETVSVDRGDWVIFQINVDNIGTQPLENMKVQDILPTDIFDMSTVQMSIDGENEAVGNWVDFNQTLFENYNSEGGFSRLLYVRGQINPNLPFNAQPITRENTVTIDGMNMPTASDTATVVVNPSKNGTLKVSKTITSANPQDPAPADAAFTFKLDANPNVSTVNSFSYTLSNGTSGTVQNGGTFVLGNGQSAEFDGFPAGSFTITEVDNTGYSTKVNGVSGTSYTGTIGTTETDKAPVVAFENQFNMRVAALNIVKELVGGKNTDVFTFTIKLENQTVGDDGTVSYGGITFKKAEGASANTAGNYNVFGTVQITGAGSKQIELPNNTKVTVTETEHPDYILSSDNNQEVTITLGTPKTVTFVNIYKTAPLIITKEVTGNPPVSEANREFTFAVTLPEGNYKYSIDGGADQDFNGTITLKNGQSAVIKDIMKDSVYSVVETNIPVGYVHTAPENASGTIKLGENANVVTFTNVYTTTDLTITKTGLNQHVYPTGDVESAIVTVSGDGYNFTVVLTEDNNYSATITQLPIGITLTVAEEEEWTWRYNSTGDDTITLVDGVNKVTIENTHVNQSWLGGDNFKTNVFGTGN